MSDDRPRTEGGEIGIQVFEKAGHSVFLGDAIEVLESRIESESVDLIFADPPYNIGKKFGEFEDRWPSDEDYAEWCKRWLQLCIDKLKPSGSMYVMCSTQSASYLDLFLRQKIHILSRIVWHYDSSGVQARRFFGSMWEPILFCVKNPQSYTFNADDIQVEARTGATRKLIDYRGKEPRQYNSKKVPGNVWSFPRVRYRMPEYEEHPSQKPEALLERIIRASSDPGNLVLDPFAGTFTTCAVAKRLGRRSVGIELQEEYAKIGLRRLEIARSYQGEELTPVAKTYQRKNGNGQRNKSGEDQARLAF